MTPLRPPRAWMAARTLALATGLVATGCTLAWAQPLAQGSGIYTCIDKNGRRLTADRPIVECLDREQRELGPSGTVRRVVGPTLTEQERAAQEVQRRKEQEERNRIADDRRRDRALLARYPDKAAHDAERANAIAQVEEVSNAAAKRIVDLQAQRKTLDVELEFYRNDPLKAPMALRRQLAENDEGILEQQRFITGQDREKRRVHQRFDIELGQLRRLWAMQHAAPAPGGAPPAADTPPAAAAAGR